MNDINYDYTTAGFDGFLSRSVDNAPQINLATPTPATPAIAFDRSQITGFLGDTLQIGKIHLNGSDENIIMSDGQNNRLLIGFQKDGF